MLGPSQRRRGAHCPCGHALQLLSLGLQCMELGGQRDIGGVQTRYLVSGPEHVGGQGCPALRARALLDLQPGQLGQRRIKLRGAFESVR